ncbi:MAG: hypothetical protein ACHBNF_04680 [Chromatiales bacterium]
MEAAIEIVTSQDESEHLKSSAIAAIRDVGTIEQRARLKGIALRSERISSNLCGLLCQALYPKVLGPQELVALLDKICDAPKRYAVSLDYLLEKHLAANLAPEHLTPLLRGFLDLVSQSPRIVINNEESLASQRFAWIEGVLLLITTRLLEQPRLEEKNIEAVLRALVVLPDLKRVWTHHDFDTAALNEALTVHTEIRRRYVWNGVNAVRSRNPAEAIGYFQAFDYRDVVNKDARDIDWLLDDVSHATKNEDRKAALVMAIDCWYSLGRPRKHLIALKKAAKKDPQLRDVLQERIDHPLMFHLRRLGHRFELHDFKWKLERFSRKCKEAYWRLRDQMWLRSHVGMLRSGEAGNTLSWLAQESNQDRHTWGGGDWRNLIPHFGQRVAEAARDGWIASWKNFCPFLPHEKPVAHETDTRVALGLTGIHVAIDEGRLAISKLSPAEATRATRYAVNELNGFPEWLTPLAATHAQPVRDVLSACVLSEWETPANQEHFHGVLSTLVYGPPALRQLICGAVLSKLKQNEPLNFQVLRMALILLVRDGLPDVNTLTALASERTGTAQDIKRRILWLSLWLQLEWQGALQYLKHYLCNNLDDAEDLMVNLCAGLGGRHHRSSELLVEKPAYLAPECLREFIPLVFTGIRLEDDIDRTGGAAYSPTTRDDAQSFRSGLLQRLAQTEETSSYETLMSLLNDPSMAGVREYLLHLIEQRAALDAEGPPWAPADVVEFAREYETDPRSVHDLFKIALRRFDDIKALIEYHDFSARDELNASSDEAALQRWLCRKLEERSRNRYKVVWSPKVDMKKEPDIRLDRAGMGSVAIEVKWADSWSLTDLEKAIRQQLVGLYLRSPNSRHGILVLGYMGRKQHWRSDTTNLDFNELVQYLETIADHICQNDSNIGGLRVIGIDFVPPNL